MTTQPFNLQNIHPSWNECITRGLAKVNPDYLGALKHSQDWLPGEDKIFNAFSLPLEKVNYVLFGESPYPRSESANGYAFWDASVKELWSETGLSKKVNRATSLRNILKMLLIAEGVLDSDNATQDEIAKIDKSNFVATNDAFFQNMLNHGFLLLNATPVLQSGPPQKDARAWLPFVHELMDCLLEKRPKVKLVLFGRIANVLEQFIKHHPHIEKLCSEHPYNISFITNPDVITFFGPLHLLDK
jgi:uracil-DNA glycosylase